MKNVPEQVKGIARTGVLRLALEKGHSVITNAVIDEAMDRFMPKSASVRHQGAGRSGRARAGEVRSRVDVQVVRRRSHAERRCEVHRLRRHGFRGDLAGDDREDCGGRGWLEEETTYDGRKLRWSEDRGKASGP